MGFPFLRCCKVKYSIEFTSCSILHMRDCTYSLTRTTCVVCLYSRLEAFLSIPTYYQGDLKMLSGMFNWISSLSYYLHLYAHTLHTCAHSHTTRTCILYTGHWDFLSPMCYNLDLNLFIMFNFEVLHTHTFMVAHTLSHNLYTLCMHMHSYTVHSEQSPTHRLGTPIVSSTLGCQNSTCTRSLASIGDGVITTFSHNVSGFYFPRTCTSIIECI